MKRYQVTTEGLVILHNAGAGQWLCFRTPRQIITAYKAEEVVPALERIESLVSRDGWHAAGFLSYEAAIAFDPAMCVHSAPDFPLLWFGIYREPEAYELQKADFGAYSLSDPVPSISQAEYDHTIERIKNYIKSGDTYQVNYTLRLRSFFRGDPFQLFLAMVQAQSAGYSAWIDTGRYGISSASPELFFYLKENELTCKPMKGTVHRGRTLAEDRHYADWLRHSDKNRAENLMIVDMIRNDLGRVADVGSVRVPRLFEVERHPTLWQMTSTITADCQESFVDIMTALFPCASITGAPKIRTMKIIAELEASPRRIYTGCIGFLAPDRTAQFSVAIRTGVVDRVTSEVEYGSGGGIVWDSACEDEFKEALLKARVLTEQRPEFSLLETLLWTPAESYFLLDYHLKRLADSANYFGFVISTPGISKKLLAEAENFSGQSMRVRLLVAPDGAVTIQPSPFESNKADRHIRLSLARKPVNSGDVFLYHKTTYRKVYDEAKSLCPDCDDVLLWNEKEEITESSIANVVVEIGEDLFTPPLDSGLLAGTYRAWLLDKGKIRERLVRVSDLSRCQKIFLINSVRKWQEAYICF